ncbi:hypothetical protein [Pseudomonas citronellolis]|uniref:hypothetical protein n=1 Tax=Pseudomonas citronellolis TaxID=53408 RepID=UPI00248EEA47|nr:hypothetical protein [Pseudomonas citronellolis]
MNHDQILQNRARLSKTDGEMVENDCCSGAVIFALQDRHHQFSLGLETVLECLRFAEGSGALPALPDDWWNSVRGRYHLPVESFE